MGLFGEKRRIRLWKIMEMDDSGQNAFKIFLNFPEFPFYFNKNYILKMSESWGGVKSPPMDLKFYAASFHNILCTKKEEERNSPTICFFATTYWQCIFSVVCIVAVKCELYPLIMISAQPRY